MPPKTSPQSHSSGACKTTNAQRTQSRRHSRSSQSTLIVGTNRHVACVTCRERKVRCDGNQPACLACSKRGQECVYSAVKHTESTGEEIARVIETLTSSLAYAEAEIAEHKRMNNKDVMPCRNSSDLSGCSSNTSDESSRRTSVGRPDPLQEILGPLSSPQSYTDDIESPLAQCGSFGCDSIETTAYEVMNNLHESYFTNFDPAFPLLNRAAYVQKCHLRPLKESVRALVYAVWMHGALGMQNLLLAENYYQHCREHLELGEYNGSGWASPQIETAQASLLMTLYEYKHMCFPRANYSATRGLRYAQMLRLDQVDSLWQENFDCVSLDWIDIEERRRVFWGAFMIDQLRESSPIFDETQILTRLPDWGFLYNDQQGGVLKSTGSPFLSDLFSSVTGLLPSPFAAAAVSTVFWSRCSMLVQVSQRVLYSTNPNSTIQFDFWARYYELDSAITAFVDTTCIHLVERYSDNCNIIFLRLMLNATTITLHRAAMTYASIMDPSTTISSESEARCYDAAKESASLVQGLLIRPDIIEKMSFFTIRCLYIAAKELTQAVTNLKGDAQFFDLLHAIVSMLNSMKRVNPIVEVYLDRISNDQLGTEDLSELAFLSI